MGEINRENGGKNMRKKSIVLDQLKLSPMIQVACSKAGISRATYYRWRETDPKFKSDSDAAQKEGVGYTNDMAESQLIKLIRDNDRQAIFYWLNNRHPDYSYKRIILNPDFLQKDDEMIENSSNINITRKIMIAMLLGKIPLQSSFIRTMNTFKERDFNQVIDKQIDQMAEIIREFSPRKEIRENPNKERSQ